MVSYIEKKPDGPFDMPGLRHGSQGKYTILDGSKVVIRWAPTGDGITEETFTGSRFEPAMLSGKSNRFADLVAVKMTDFSKKKR